MITRGNYDTEGMEDTGKSGCNIRGQSKNSANFYSDPKMSSPAGFLIKAGLAETPFQFGEHFGGMNIQVGQQDQRVKP